MQKLKAEHSTTARTAANDNGADAATYDEVILSVVGMLARYSAAAPVAVNDNRATEPRA